MLKNIIFDFGDVFINLDKQAIFRELGERQIDHFFPPELLDLNNRFEVGAVSPDEFVAEWATIFSRIGDFGNYAYMEYHSLGFSRLSIRIS